MIKNIKNCFKTSALLLAGSFLLWSCESEADQLGSQFFDNIAAEGTAKAFDIIAYNVNNQDSIRTDAAKLTSATLGAFHESQFGLQKSNFVSQVRLSSYNPDFGTNPVVDSVVLEINPVYRADSVTTTTDENYVYPVGSVEAKKVVSTYPISRYGKANATMTLNVHEVDDFLGSSSDKVYSNQSVNYSTLLGSKAIAPKVSSVKITKKSDNTDLLSREARIRIPLDKDFFQSKLIAKKGQAELSDVSNFIRYFKGIRVSVQENDGYLFNFSPNDTQIVVYYKRDVTSNGTTTAEPTSYTLTLGSGNARFNQITFDRTGTPSEAVANLTSPNYQSGDAKIYAQGMGGPSVGIKIPEATIEELRTLYKNNKIGIVSAKVRLFTDTSVWNNSYAKPSTFVNYHYDATTKSKSLSEFLSDVRVFSAIGIADLIKGYNLTENPSYYDFTITQSIKNAVEQSTTMQDIVLEVGAFQVNKNNLSALIGPAYNTRAYTPNRVVLVGTDAANENRAKLNIVYSSK